MKPIVLLVALSLACASSLAQELLVLGKVISTRAVKTGEPDCPSQSGSFPQPDGTVKIVVSNQCGCEWVDVAIDEALIGNKTDARRSFQIDVGEWCSVHVTHLGSPVLAYSNGKETAVSFPVSEAKDYRFQRGDLTHLLGLPSDPDKHSRNFSLDALREELKARRR